MPLCRNMQADSAVKNWANVMGIPFELYMKGSVQQYVYLTCFAKSYINDQVKNSHCLFSRNVIFRLNTMWHGAFHTYINNYDLKGDEWDFAYSIGPPDIQDRKARWHSQSMAALAVGTGRSRCPQIHIGKLQMYASPIRLQTAPPRNQPLCSLPIRPVMFWINGFWGRSCIYCSYDH